jgi:hypothetical protein
MSLSSERTPGTFEVPLDIRVNASANAIHDEQPAWIRVSSVNGGSAFQREVESS